MFNENELNEIKSFSPETREGKYLKAGLHKVKITEYELVEPGNGKCPYFQFIVEDEYESRCKCKLFRVSGNESEQAKTIKLDNLKRLAIAAKADFGQKDPKKFAQSMTNNYFQIALRKKDYIGYDANNSNKPVIKFITEYSFAEPILDEHGKPNVVIMKESYLEKELSADEMKSFKSQLEDWELKHNSNEPSTVKENSNQEEEDDLPF